MAAEWGRRKTDSARKSKTRHCWRSAMKKMSRPARRANVWYNQPGNGPALPTGGAVVIVAGAAKPPFVALRRQNLINFFCGRPMMGQWRALVANRIAVGKEKKSFFLSS